jgi:hypothetical protein
MADWVKEGCRWERGDEGRPRRFSAKLERWLWLEAMLALCKLEEECVR